MVESSGSSKGKWTPEHQGRKNNLEIQRKCAAMSDSVETE